MNDKAFRDRLVEKLSRMGLVPGPPRQGDPYPVISLEDFFEGNNDAGSIACNLQEAYRLKIGEWFQILKRIRDRQEVQDVLVEIFEVPEDGETWPSSDRIYVLTSAGEEEVKSWMQPLRPDELAEGYIEGVPPGAPVLAHGKRVYQAWWD